MFLDLLDPYLVARAMDPDPDPDPSIIKQKNKKNLDSYCVLLLFDFLSLKNDVNVQSKSNKLKNFFLN
jgi:hypothetical protein